MSEQLPPVPAEPIEAPGQTDRGPHPISLVVTDDLKRSRLLVFFRLPMAIPHLVWLYAWGYVAEAVAILTWLCALVIGRPPRPFHRFLGAYIRYQAHFMSFMLLVGNPFPGFVGARGSYPVDLQTPLEPQHQNRLATLVRLLLAIPALILCTVLTYAMLVVGVFGWFVSLFLGRMPEGLRDLGAFVIRYNGQVYGYLFFQTARYPNASPRRDLTLP